MDKLKAALGFGGILSKQNIEKVSAHFSKKELAAGTHFSALGKVANQIGFIEKGIVRSYAITEQGNEVTNYFYRENQFVVDLQSYYSRQPSTSPLQAVVKSHVYVVKRQQWEKLTEEIPHLFVLTKSLSEALLLNKLKDNDFIGFATATDKYKEFVNRYPDLALAVPQQYIASYLHITPQSLSRIRKKLVESKK